MKEVDDSNRKNGVGVDLFDERCLQTSEGEEYCVKHSISMLIIVVLLLILFKLFI